MRHSSDICEEDNGSSGRLKRLAWYDKLPIAAASIRCPVPQDSSSQEVVTVDGRVKLAYSPSAYKDKP